MKSIRLNKTCCYYIDKLFKNQNICFNLKILIQKYESFQIDNFIDLLNEATKNELKTSPILNKVYTISVNCDNKYIEEYKFSNYIVVLLYLEYNNKIEKAKLKNCNYDYNIYRLKESIIKKILDIEDLEHLEHINSLI